MEKKSVKKTFRINNSGFKDWQQCKRLYYYQQILNLEHARKKNIYFIRGHLYHDFVERALKRENAWKFFNEKVTELQAMNMELQEKKDLEDTIYTARVVLNEWQKYPLPLEPEATEMYIEHKIGEDGDIDIIFEGKIDAYGKSQKLRLGVYELKSKSSSNVEPITERFRPQAVLYAGILRRYDIGVDHLIREFIICPKMHKPQLKKNGQMSRANISCTWDYYRKELMAHGLNPSEYEDEMRPKLKFDPSFIMHTRLNQRMLDMFEALVIRVAKEIMREKEFPRSWGFGCARCPFKEPCFAGIMSEQDEASLLKNSYREKKSHYD